MKYGKYKVLLIEDDKLDRLAFQRLVEAEKLQYDYTITGSVTEVQRLLVSEAFDIIVSDYSLKDGTALDILNSVKNIPVILTTGAADEAVAIKAWKAGAYDYLQKDFNRNYLKALPKAIENAIKRRKIEEALDTKQKNLEAIFDAAPIGMLLANKNMIVTRVNDAVRQMLRREYQQIINRQICDTLGCINNTGNENCGSNPACAQCLIETTTKSVLDTGRPIHNLEVHPTLKIDNKETHIWLRMSTEPIMIDNNKHVLLALDDITVHKKAQEKLKETMELKSQFIATVSHELRTPLTGIKEGLAIVLDEVVGPINEKQRRFLDIAKRNVERLTDLISDLLDFRKLESGRMKLHINSNDIEQVVSEVREIMALCAEKAKVELLFDCPRELPRAEFDREKIIQVLTNLISNGIKFTPENGQVSVKVEHRVRDWVLSVSDTGIGIPKEDIPKIFERFYRVQQPGREIQGTGLGLAIVHEIVILHGGRIEVESQQNTGTTFTVFLPVEVEKPSEMLPGDADEFMENTVSMTT